MTNEFDVLKRALAEHETALKMKNLNQELMEFLTGSIYEVIRCADENGISLSKRDKLLKLMERANIMIENIISTSSDRSFTPHQPKGNTDNLPTRKQNLCQGTVTLQVDFH